MAAIALALAACSPVGDFGRPAPDLTHVGSTIGDDSRTYFRWYPDSRPHLTESERELRDRAWYFLRRCEPYYSLARSGSREPGLPGYYEALVRRRPPDAAWAQLADDIATDTDLMGAFFRVAGRVEHTDERRAARLWRPTPAARDAAPDLSVRLGENGELIDAVEGAAWFRLASFGYAADRLSIEAPSAEQRKVRIAMKMLRRTLAQEPPPQPPPPLVIRAEPQ